MARKPGRRSTAPGANLSYREFVSRATKHHGVVRLIAVHEQDRRGLAIVIAEVLQLHRP